MQIIINILSNSFKFTEYGGITISVSLQSTENKSNLSNLSGSNGVNDANNLNSLSNLNNIYNLLFTIKDTGCGMSVQQKNNINSMLTETLWTNKYVDGFGLIICKNLCELLGGELWFKSEMGMGTTFYFNIKCECLKII